MSIETIGGPVETTEEYDEAAAHLEELEAREAELEAELAELEAREEELIEKSGQLRAEQDQVESGIAAMQPKLQEAERAKEKAAAICHQEEAERLAREGRETLTALLEAADRGVELYRKWFGGEGELGDADRFKRVARRGTGDPVATPKNEVASSRGELGAVLSAFETLSGAKRKADRQREAEAENEAAE